MGKKNKIDRKVFISYAREDAKAASDLAQRLEKLEIDVFWDFHLSGGQDFRAVIQKNIDESDFVIVLWSPFSIGSHFVIDEASQAKKQGKLVPVAIEDVEPPLGFGALHKIDYRSDDASFSRILDVLENRSHRVEQSDKDQGGINRRILIGGMSALCIGAIGLAAPRFAQGINRRLRPDLKVPRFALVIGNSNYQNVASLKNPGNDADAISTLLEERRFKTATLFDASEDEMRGSIEEFKVRLSLGGVGVFYFAGHAAHIGGQDFALAVDADGLNSPEDFARVAINITDVSSPITTFFSSLSEKIKFAGLCVWSGDECLPPPRAVLPIEKERSEKTLKDIAPDRTIEFAKSSLSSKTQIDHGVSLLYAASRGEVALDGQNNHSPFAEALLTEIPKRDGRLSSVVKAVRSKVIETTNGTQHPVGEDKSQIEFSFNRTDLDPTFGVLRIVFLDSCRDNPFALNLQR